MDTNQAVVEKKTVFFEEHQRLGGKIISFGGWKMPVSFAGTLAEHKTVREACGIFDVSHMGEVFVRGKNATAFVQKVAINDVEKLKNGQAQYSAILNEKGGMIDDLLVYRLDDEKDGRPQYLLCVNAGNTDKDFAWLQKQAAGFQGVEVQNESSKWSQIALQGPSSREVLKKTFPEKYQVTISELPYTGAFWVQAFGEKCLIARTGYTGELGFEIYLPNKAGVECWNHLLKHGQNLGIKPIGLGARDTLRLEACYLLYGNDMDESVTPLEAGISWATKMNGPEFIGKNVLIEQKEKGIPRKNMAFQMTDGGIPRHDMDVYYQGEIIGKVTSGSVLPTVGGAGGMVLVKASKVKVGDSLEIDVRGKRKLAQLVKKPLYSARVSD